MNRDFRIGVIGGGAAGYFAAIMCAEQNPDARVVILEATANPLQKVQISGGGRCNVTAACFDPAVLVRAYPRGGMELRGPFTRFQPRDTIDWFERRGVRLKTEADGRVFPVSNRSETIVDCLRQAAHDTGVAVRCRRKAIRVRRPKDGHFEIEFSNGEREEFDRILVATGSAAAGHAMAKSLGHTIAPCVPSLFTFEIDDPRLSGLAGLSFPDAHLRLMVGGRKVAEEQGAVLITHWGLSGPAVLRLSAWAARKLHDAGYRAELRVNWCGVERAEKLVDRLRECKATTGRKVVLRDQFSPLPQRFWARIAATCGVGTDLTWANLDRATMQKIAAELTSGIYRVCGKGVFKEEFVTCGGVSLREVDFRTMESRLQPGLYFAGEVLDIDGITGGYNFQSAWTTGWIAGRSMAANDD